MSISPPPENLPVVLNADTTDMKQVVDIKSDDPSDQDENQLAISSIGDDEPLVTRRELWSYYRAYQ